MTSLSCGITGGIRTSCSDGLSVYFLCITLSNITSKVLHLFQLDDPPSTAQHLREAVFRVLEQG